MLIVGKKILTIFKRIIIWGCLTILLVILMLILLVKYMNKREENFLDFAQNVFVIVSQTEDGGYQVDEVVQENYITDWDYSESRATLLFANEIEGNIIEKNLITGAEEILIIPGLEKMVEKHIQEMMQQFEHFNVDEYDVRTLMLRFLPQYLPNDDDISFTVGDAIYIWHREKNEVEKVDIPPNPLRSGPKRYRWMENGDLIFVYRSQKRGNGLARWYKEGGKVEDIGYNMEAFLLDEEKKVIYGIYEEIYWNENLGYYNSFSLIEKNWETKEERRIMEKYTSENTYELAHEGDKLFYVDEGIWITEQEIICVDIRTGIDESIYHTDNLIVGIIVQ